MVRPSFALLIGLLLTSTATLAAASSGMATADPRASEGALLAAVGGCAGCHTRGDGAPYAGGVPLTTSFGTIYATNITPDLETGIGRWTAEDFARAMRHGVEPNGRHLYPAFPYDHFTHSTTGDLQTLYAYLMSLQPVNAPALEDNLAFPFGFRGAMLGWNAAYLNAGPLAEEPGRDAEFNRGKYLVEALGHCGGCHTPRDALGGEQKDKRLAGAIIDGWYAPPLDARSPSPIPWTVEALSDYLAHGIAQDHAIAGGPMQDVVRNLGKADARDLRAIAVYLVANMGPPTPARNARAETATGLAQHPLAFLPEDVVDPRLALGASVYADACASCHDGGRRVSSTGALQLPLAVAVHDADPNSLLRIIRDGVMPGARARGRWMPGFDGALSDRQIEALTAYLRRAAGNEPAWPDLESAVKDSAE